MLPTAAGIGPVNLLKARFMVLRNFRFPIDAGRFPEILLRNKFKDCRLVKLPISFGNSPVRLLFDKSMPTTLSLSTLTPYHFSTGAFMSHLLDHCAPLVLLYSLTNAFFSAGDTLAKAESVIPSARIRVVMFFMTIWFFCVIRRVKRIHYVDNVQIKS